MKVFVKFSGTTYPVEVEPTTSINVLCDELEKQTGVLARKQKIIFKGKLRSMSETLDRAKITEGSKLMMLATDGAPSKGETAAKQVASQKAADVLQRSKDRQSTARQTAVGAPPSPKDRLEGWRKTGIVSLQQSGISSFPEDVLALGLAVRVANLSSNKITQLPPTLVCLANLQKLYLGQNDLTSECIPWAEICQLRQLVVLGLDNNKITDVPEVLCTLTSLTHLALNSNNITSLPETIGQLTNLQLLRLQCNKITSLPASLGDCVQLLEVNLCENALTQLPPELGKLNSLRTLLLDDNKIAAVPPAILRDCVMLSTLKLHNNPIHVERLRDTEGYAEYDARRKAKHDKQVDMSVLDTHFDEGADIVQWARWGANKKS